MAARSLSDISHISSKGEAVRSVNSSFYEGYCRPTSISVPSGFKTHGGGSGGGDGILFGVLRGVKVALLDKLGAYLCKLGNIGAVFNFHKDGGR